MFIDLYKKYKRIIKPMNNIDLLKIPIRESFLHYFSSRRERSERNKPK